MICHMGTVYKQSELSNSKCKLSAEPFKEVSSRGIATIFKIVVLFLLPVCSSAISECLQNTPCSCLYKDGSGYIDLHPVSRSDGKPFFSGISDDDGGVLQYNPCSNFSEHNSPVCTNVVLCRKNLNDSTFNNIGNLKDASFGTNQEIEQHYLLYTTPHGNTTVQVVVYLDCKQNRETSYLTAQRNGSEYYSLILSSRAACKVNFVTDDKSLSIGSWLCILFASVVLGYFGTGVLYRRVAHGASGVHVIPNYEFWMELPSLVKDGYIFFISPCLGNDARYHAYRYEPL